NQRIPWVVGDGKGTMYASWYEQDPSDPKGDVFVSRSTDWGLNWERRGQANPTPASVRIFDDSQARIGLAPNGDLFVVYYVPVGANFPDVGVSKSVDGGMTFTEIFRAPLAERITPHIDAQGALHVFWLDRTNQTPGRARLAHVSSSDGGSSFSAKKFVDTGQTDGDSCRCCSVFATNGPAGEIFLAWRSGAYSNKRDTYFAKSTDGGATWTAPKLVSDWTWNITSCPWSGPYIALEPGGRMHILSMDARSGDRDLFHYRSADGGATWTNASLIHPADAKEQDNPAVAFIDSKLVAAWVHDNQNVLVATSPDGSSWSAPTPIADSPTGAKADPAVEYTSDAAVFLWSDNRSGGWDVYAATYFRTDTVAPTVQITAPADGATVGATVNVDATASDDLAVTNVEFRLDGTKTSLDSSPPYRWTWDTTTVPDGNHQISALAYDAAGNSKTHSITVTVSNQGQDKTPPTVSITSPSNGATVNGQVTIAADATDNKGVASVEFFVDGASVGKDASSPFSAAWDTTQASQGSHTLKATAADTSANTADSTVSVIVDNAAKDSLPPVVAITSPADGATVSGTITLNADITDNVKVKEATLYVDGTLVGGPKSAAPWDWTLDTRTYANGDRNLEARASDDAGNVGTKKIVVKFDNQMQDAPPTIAITNPTDGAKVSGKVTLKATATDDRGIEYVDFRVDGNAVRRVSIAPYETEFDSSTVSDGPHVIVAEVKDFIGQPASDQVTVTVSNSPGGGGGGGGPSGLLGIIADPLYLGLLAGALVATAAGIAAAIVVRRRRREREATARAHATRY
ncbi:MAG TPA: Ig-like domain-containing protein, partial [Thermoplasmata archaeon]|nr:Ig-like domain-containing protein [Thermoplasmata archaeon]